MPEHTDLVNSLIADDLSSAADDVRSALTRYLEIAEMAAELDPTPISYQQSTVLYDTVQYTLENVNALSRFRGDHVLVEARNAEHPYLEMMMLAASPHWEDRIRAKALHLDLDREITLPDDFPCIYEPADSPRRRSAHHAKPFVWVASADEALLHQVLPHYRELWDSHQAQWPHSPNREFVVGRLSGIEPYAVFRPGATIADVIGKTLLTHPDMYERAPKHLQEMSFRHRAKNTKN
ncbi:MULTISPECIES: hypothetical protein [unclassified Microbacterium]|uniref:hypothetical protein n=1 Tax=unclassified Microbacterium TaxID=2609290 RepID=UPI002882E029|nr:MULTISPECIES: hypothetical protein [unclassified Microbacterium]